MLSEVEVCGVANFERSREMGEL